MSGRYGPNSAEVQRLRSEIKTISKEQSIAMNDLWEHQDEDIWYETWRRVHETIALWNGGRSKEWTKAWADIWDKDIRGEILESRWACIRDAALAILVRDLISDEDFNVLYNPWASVMEVENDRS